MKKIISSILTVCLLIGVLAVLPITVGAAEAITITSVDDWMEKLSGQSVGEANITVTATELDFTGKELKPIKDFKGSFEGNGVVIKNANINNEGDECGLFYCLDGAATFRNFTIKSSTFEGKQWIGAIACCICGDTTVENVYVDNDVNVKATDGTAGGLIGGCTSGSNITVTFTDCVVAATVDGGTGKYVGGFLGNGQTKDASKVKTIVLTNCMMLGSVNSDSSDISGFIGYNLKKVDGVYHGSITATNCIYAGRGFISYPLGKAGVFTAENCYTTHVNADNKLYNSGDVAITTENENTGVTVIDASVLLGSDASLTVEGFTKRANDIMVPNGIATTAPELYTKTYTVTWVSEEQTLATETYNYGSIPSFKGETPTKAEDDRFTYSFDKWDPAVVMVNEDVTYTAEFSKASKFTGDTSNVWDEWDGTADDPYDAEGKGTAEEPYVIRTAEQWANLANASAAGIADGLYFILEANLDFKNIYTEESKLQPISPDGKKLLIYFDGKGHTIKGVNMVGTKDGTALFGDIWGDKDLTKNQVSCIKNLVITESTFTSEKGWMSAVVGEASGSLLIENIYVDKTVTINSSGTKGKAGGIVGGCYYSSSNPSDAEYTVTINDCVFAGKILSAGEGNGGIVGYGNSKKDGDYDEVIRIVINRCLVVGYVQHDQNYSNGFVGFNGLPEYKSATGATPSVTINDSILASGAKGEYYGNYPFANAPVVTVRNSYTVSAGDNGVMYVSGTTDGTLGVTILQNGRNDILGADCSIIVDGWTKRDGDVMVPTGVVTMAPKFISDVTVKWEVDGVVVSEETYAMGDMPSFKNGTPTKADDDTYSYTFYGWSPAVSVAVGDVTYVAEFYKTRKNVEVEDENDGKDETKNDTTVTEKNDVNTEAPVNESGCGSVIGGGAVALMAVVGSALVIGRKRKQD